MKPHKICIYIISYAMLTGIVYPAEHFLAPPHIPISIDELTIEEITFFRDEREVAGNIAEVGIIIKNSDTVDSIAHNLVELLRNAEEYDKKIFFQFKIMEMPKSFVDISKTFGLEILENGNYGIRYDLSKFIKAIIKHEKSAKDLISNNRIVTFRAYKALVQLAAKIEDLESVYRKAVSMIKNHDYIEAKFILLNLKVRYQRIYSQHINLARQEKFESLIQNRINQASELGKAQAKKRLREVAERIAILDITTMTIEDALKVIKGLKDRIDQLIYVFPRETDKLEKELNYLISQLGWRAESQRSQKLIDDMTKLEKEVDELSITEALMEIEAMEARITSSDLDVYKRLQRLSKEVEQKKDLLTRGSALQSIDVLSELLVESN